MTEEREQKSRWVRREVRRKRARGRMQKHGASVGRLYVAAVRKRFSKLKGRPARRE